MQSRRNNCQLILQPDFCVSVALLVLLLPLQWAVAWLFAAAVHEACHYLALRACKVQVYAVNVGLGGAVMQTGALYQKLELLCAAAGPMGGFCLLCFIKIYPELALCGLIQSIYNLLPILPLDGGRILQSLVGALFSPEICNYVLIAVKVFVLTFLLCTAVVCALYFDLGILPILWAILFTIKHVRVKRPCKRRKQIVQ